MGRTQSLPAVDPNQLRDQRTAAGDERAPDQTESPAESAAETSADDATDAAMSSSGFGFGSQRKSEVDYERAVQAVLSQHTGAHQAVASSRYSMSTPMAGSRTVTGISESSNSSSPSVAASPDVEQPSDREAPTAGSGIDPAPASPAAPRPAAQQLHKIRAASGIVYDFHDEAAVRKWLVTRGSFDDLSYSPDGGEIYVPVLAVEGFSDLRPGGLKTQTGSLPAITPDVLAARRLSEPTESRPEDLTTAGRVRTLKPNTSKADAVADTTGAQGGRDTKVKKIPVWRAALYVLLATLAALVAAYAFAPSDNSIRIPDTPAGQQLQWVMTTIHGQSGALNLGVMSNHIVAEQLETAGPAVIQNLQYIDGWRDTITLTDILVSEDERVLALLTTDRADDGWVLIECSPAPPHLMTRMEFGRGEPAPNLLR